MLFLAGYAGIGCLIFKGSEEGDLFFATFGDGMWNLLILLTTANNPDVRDHRQSLLWHVCLIHFGVMPGHDAGVQ